jgi:hypothetical protein
MFSMGKHYHSLLLIWTLAVKSSVLTLMES